MTNLQSLLKRWVEKKQAWVQPGMCQRQLKIIIQLPFNTGLSNSLDYKIPDIL